jgi:hypothetical protein
MVAGSMLAWWSSKDTASDRVGSEPLVVEACDGGGADDCVRSSITRVFESGGVDAAVGEFERLASSSEQLRFNCHAWLHEIGELAGTYTDWSELPEVISIDCQGGLLHGVLQGVATRLDENELQGFVNGFCAQRKAPADFTTEMMGTECAHGIGHALAVRLFPDVESAVSLCHPSGLTGQEQQLCVGGVLMEVGYANLVVRGYASGEARVGFSGVDALRVVELCNSIRGDGSLFSECVSRWWMFAGPEIGDHPSRMYMECIEKLSVGNPDESGMPCARGVGSWAVQAAPRNSGDEPWSPYVARYASACNSLPGSAAGWCFYQLVQIVLVPALTAQSGSEELPDVCASARSDARKLCQDGTSVSREMSGLGEDAFMNQS